MNKTITISIAKNGTIGCLLEDNHGPQSFDWFGGLDRLKAEYPEYEIIDITEPDSSDVTENEKEIIRIKTLSIIDAMNESLENSDNEEIEWEDIVDALRCGNKEFEKQVKEDKNISANVYNIMFGINNKLGSRFMKNKCYEDKNQEVEYLLNDALTDYDPVVFYDVADK